MHTLYVVVRADGSLKGRKNELSVPGYRKLATAKARALDPGDSVVKVLVDLSIEPLFIRELKL